METISSLKQYNKLINLSPYLASPITVFTGFLITSAGVLDCFFGPECANDGWNDRINDRLQEPLIHPQEDRNHNAGNAHHGCAVTGCLERKIWHRKRQQINAFFQ